jgi:hypothetical protein
MRKILLVAIAHLNCVTTMGMIDNCATAYDKEDKRYEIYLPAMKEKCPSITRLHARGTINPRCWPNLPNFPNLEVLSLENVNQCNFRTTENWVLFFRSIQRLPIKILNLSHQLTQDGFWGDVPESVKYLISRILASLGSA